MVKALIAVLLIPFLLVLYLSYIKTYNDNQTKVASIKYQITELFTHEGCTVFRFYDKGWKHFSKCDIKE